MKRYLIILALLMAGSAWAQDAKVKNPVAAGDQVTEDFQFTIDPESTQDDIDRISKQLAEIGVKHKLKILGYTNDGLIKSIEFRQLRNDGSNGLGCVVGSLRKWTLYALDGKLGCRSE